MYDNMKIVIDEKIHPIILLKRSETKKKTGNLNDKIINLVEDKIRAQRPIKDAQ